jgi:hypothetical protein
MSTYITADQARDNDVVKAQDGTVYQLLGGLWYQPQIVPFYGPPFKPDGELELLARDGEPGEESQG